MIDCPNQDCLGGDDHAAAVKAYRRMVQSWARSDKPYAAQRVECYTSVVAHIEACPHKEVVA